MAAKKKAEPSSKAVKSRNYPPPNMDVPRTPRAELRVQQRATLYQQALARVKDVPAFNGQYTEELGLILAEFTAQAITLEQMSTLPNMPNLCTLLRWIAQSDHPFHKLYWDAKQILVPLYEERAHVAAIRPIRSVTKTKREVLDNEGRIVTLHEEREADNVERSKLIVNTHLWTLSHMAPKKHGPKADPTPNKGNDELEALFSNLKAGPIE